MPFRNTTQTKVDTSKFCLKTCVIVAPLNLIWHYYSKKLNIDSPILDAFVITITYLILTNFFVLKPLFSKEIKRASIIYDALKEIAIVSETDAKGKITYVNPKFVELSGYSEKELIGQDHKILNSQKNAPDLFKKMWTTLSSHQHWRGDIINRSKQGELYTVDSTIIPIIKSGKITGYISVRLDITQKQRDKELINQKNQELNALLSSSKYAIITTNTEGVITIFNNSAEKLLGYTKEEVTGVHTHCLFHLPEELELERKNLEEQYQVKISPKEILTYKAKRDLFSEGEWTFVSKNKTTVPVRLNVCSIKNTKDEIVGYMGVAKDITRERVLARQLELEKSKNLHNSRLSSLGEMSAGLAHEINNPLMIIAGNLNLLRQSIPETDITTRRLGSVEKSIGRISDILSGLKKFSRSNSDNKSMTININGLFSEAIKLIQLKPAAKNTNIQLEVDDVNPLLVKGNECSLEQVFINLLNNSIDAVGCLNDKWIKVKIGQESNHVKITITDSGLGIPAHIKEKLFEPFFTTKEVGRGTGLGLSISQGIIKDHGGDLSIDSHNPNTCFVITLPKYQGEFYEKN